MHEAKVEQSIKGEHKPVLYFVIGFLRVAVFVLFRSIIWKKCMKYKAIKIIAIV